MENSRLRKREKITRSIDFQIVFKRGTRYSTPHFTVIMYRNSTNTRRLGMSVSKKVGSAVKRNRVKRLLREFFRLSKPRLPKGYDFVFVAKPDSAGLSYNSLAAELTQLFDDASPA